jgi:hypothetical protein
MPYLSHLFAEFPASLIPGEFVNLLLIMKKYRFVFTAILAGFALMLLVTACGSSKKARYNTCPHFSDQHRQTEHSVSAHG